jgi:hypothetical protein
MSTLTKLIIKKKIPAAVSLSLREFDHSANLLPVALPNGGRCGQVVLWVEDHRIRAHPPRQANKQIKYVYMGMPGRWTVSRETTNDAN